MLFLPWSSCKGAGFLETSSSRFALACALISAAPSFRNPDPKSKVFKKKGPKLKPSVVAQGIILFISAGSGMVELDFCCSGAVAREMRKSLRQVGAVLIVATSILAATVNATANTVSQNQKSKKQSSHRRMLLASCMLFFHIGLQSYVLLRICLTTLCAHEEVRDAPLAVSLLSLGKAGLRLCRR